MYTYLPPLKERALEALCEHTPPYIPRRALQQGPAHVGAVATASCRMKAHDGSSGFSSSAPIEAERQQKEVKFLNLGSVIKSTRNR